MKKLFSKTAISLLELIIASVLVVVMVLGIFAVNMVLNGNSTDYGQKYTVKSSAQTTLNHILNNAALAIGSGTTDLLTNGTQVFDQGIILDTDANVGWTDTNMNTFCIHQDIQPPPYSSPMTIDNAPVNPTPSIPSKYTTSTRWLCYTLYQPNNAFDAHGNSYDYEIYYCAMAYSLGNIQRGAASCDPTQGSLSNTPSQYLGSAYSLNPNFTFGTIQQSAFNTTSLPALNSNQINNILIPNLITNGYLSNSVFSNTYIITLNTNNLVLNSTDSTVNAQNVNVYNLILPQSKLFFSLTIQNYLNNSGSTSDPTNNPGVTVSGSIIPSQEGVQQP